MTEIKMKKAIEYLNDCVREDIGDCNDAKMLVNVYMLKRLFKIFVEEEKKEPKESEWDLHAIARTYVKDEYIEEFKQQTRGLAKKKIDELKPRKRVCPTELYDFIVSANQKMDEM